MSIPKRLDRVLAATYGKNYVESCASNHYDHRHGVPLGDVVYIKCYRLIELFQKFPLPAIPV